MALIDTGALVAMLDPHDPRSRVARRVLRGLRPPLLTTWPVVAEALHLLGNAAEDRHAERWYGQSPLHDLLTAGGVLVPDFTSAQAVRSLDLMRQYADRPMDFADASLVALAEASADLRVVSFDGDFLIYRTQDNRPLVVLDGSR